MALWNSSYETGHALVDNDHKEIFGLVEEVLTSSFLTRKEKVQTSLQFLAKYVVRHFANEENLMAECDYPESDAHKAEHKAFTDVATALLERFGDDGYILGENTDENSLHLSMEINKTVVGWLSKHIMGSDKKLATYYRDWSNK